MALVSGVRSTLNPNAPLFIPAAVRQVEDFSPEWWNLVTTSTWFKNYWLSQQQGDDVFGEEEQQQGYDGTDVVGLLPDSIDFGVDDDILNMEAQFEEFLQAPEIDYGTRGLAGNGYGNDVNALVRNTKKMPSPKSPVEPMRYWEKPAKHVSPRYSPRSIQQPR